MIEQLSVYAENNKGAMRRILSLLSRRGINVLGFVNNDSAEFGTMRLIVSDCALALDQLKQAGYLCKTDSIIGLELDDRPGELEQVLTFIEKHNINVNYTYVGYSRESSKPIILIHCEDMDIVSDGLVKAGYKVY